MTDQQFLERMIFLTHKMCDVWNEEPFDQDAYDAVLNDISESATSFNRAHRRKELFIHFFIFTLLLLLSWIVCSILF